MYNTYFNTCMYETPDVPGYCHIEGFKCSSGSQGSLVYYGSSTSYPTLEDCIARADAIDGPCDVVNTNTVDER